MWAIGMLFFGIAAGCEAIGAASGWNSTLYRTWYAIGVATPAWLGLGTAFLLGRTRFGYAYATLVILAALLVFAARNRYPDVGSAPVYLLAAGIVLGLAIWIESYFQNDRWPQIAALGVVVETGLVAGIIWSATLAAPGFALDARTQVPTGELLPGTVRLLALLLNLPGALALVLGAIFSTYVFMPKRRVLDYSLDPGQPGDQFLFNLFIAPVAIVVNLVASLPGTVAAFRSRQIHSRVPATIFIAVGAFIPSLTDSLNRLGSTELFEVGKLLGVVFLFAGFLVSIEVFREIRVPFTQIRLATARREREVERAPESSTAPAAKRP